MIPRSGSHRPQGFPQVSTGLWTNVPAALLFADTEAMPELPEVEALAGFLRERAVGHAVARVDVLAISALKTYDPPVTALGGLTVTGAARHGKFLDLDVDGLHLVFHLARAGWLRWSDALSNALVRPAGGLVQVDAISELHLDRHR